MTLTPRSNDYRAIVHLGLPILIGQLGMIVTGFFDTNMVGMYTTEALASASFVNNLFNVAIFACMGFTYGLTPLAGALFTQGKHRDIGMMVKNAVVANVAFTLLIAAAMLVVYLNLEHLDQPAELLPLIGPYFLIYLAGLLPVALFNVFAQWAYAINRSPIPMWIILISNVVNIVGNYLLIEGHCGMPEMGLNGAGVATLVSRVFAMTAIVAVFLFKREFSEYSKGFVGRGINRPMLVKVSTTSLPVAAQMALESGSFTAAAVMAGWLGTLELAAFQIIVMTGTLGFCVYYSIGAAVSVLVSNQLGLGDRVAMRRVAFSGYHVMLVVASVSSAIFIFGGRFIIGIFTEDQAVIAMASTLILPLVIYQLGDATQITFANALRGTTVVKPMMWIAFVSYILVGIPATYMLGIKMEYGIDGILYSFSVSLFLAAALFLTFFIKSSRPS